MQGRIASVRARVDWTRFTEDPMFGGNEAHYANVGESALRCIFASLMLAGRGDPASVLDFACATGRVTRWVRAAFPEAALHVADLRADWTQWNAERFDATGWASAEDISAVAAPRRFELIWCGSLATHISAGQTRALLRQFHDWLDPGGVCVLTTHGRRFIANARSRIVKYFADPDSIEPLLEQLALSGYGFVAHPGQTSGISANTVEWMLRAIADLGARLVTFGEHAWDNHQDVVAFQRTT